MKKKEYGRLEYLCKKEPKGLLISFIKSFPRDEEQEEEKGKGNLFFL